MVKIARAPNNLFCKCGWLFVAVLNLSHLVVWGGDGVSVKDKQGDKKKAPVVVIHPLTWEERLGEDDLMRYEPLMQQASPFERVQADRVEVRSEKMEHEGFKTDAPFVDWAHYAVLALGALDPKSEDDGMRMQAWGHAYERHRAKAKVLFESNYEGRVETIADNGLCAYRESSASKQACIQAARARAKVGSPALGMPWASWVEWTAIGLAQHSGWPAQWALKKKGWLADGKTEENVEEVLLKVKRLDAWAVKLNPAVPVIPYDAWEQAKQWAESTCWSAQKAQSTPWGAFVGACPSKGAKLW
jgi:hypothetical protein